MSFLDYAAARQKRNSFPMQQLSSKNWYEVEKSVENWFLSKNWTNIILNKIYSIFLSSRNNWGRWSTYQSPRSLSRLISSLWTAGTPSSTKWKQVRSKQNSFMVIFRSTQFFSPTSKECADSIDEKFRLGGRYLSGASIPSLTAVSNREHSTVHNTVHSTAQQQGRFRSGEFSAATQPSDTIASHKEREGS